MHYEDLDAQHSKFGDSTLMSQQPSIIVSICYDQKSYFVCAMT